MPQMTEDTSTNTFILTKTNMGPNYSITLPTKYKNCNHYIQLSVGFKTCSLASSGTTSNSIPTAVSFCPCGITASTSSYSYSLPVVSSTPGLLMSNSGTYTREMAYSISDWYRFNITAVTLKSYEFTCKSASRYMYAYVNMGANATFSFKGSSYTLEPGGTLYQKFYSTSYVSWYYRQGRNSSEVNLGVDTTTNPSFNNMVGKIIYEIECYIYG